jgi:hypothetical protein
MKNRPKTRDQKKKDIEAKSKGFRQFERGLCAFGIAKGRVFLREVTGKG